MENPLLRLNGMAIGQKQNSNRISTKHQQNINKTSTKHQGEKTT